MERPGPATLLPPDYRTYLGGSSDLRGFSRQELPTDGEGGMSSFYLGVETRFSGVLPWNLEPLFLFDVGALGSKPVSLDMPIYWSPGFGMRFESPIGTFRGTLANGFVGSGVHDWSGSHWQLYLSLGEEF
jgi:outer membrane translocation and assembly module TamA